MDSAGRSPNGRASESNLDNPDAPPWWSPQPSHAPYESAIRERCLELTTGAHQDCFERIKSASGSTEQVDFCLTDPANISRARAALAADSNLESLRFFAVPRLVKENEFWVLYFGAVRSIRVTFSRLAGAEDVDGPWGPRAAVEFNVGEAGRYPDASDSVAVDTDGCLGLASEEPTASAENEGKDGDAKESTGGPEEWELELQAELDAITGGESEATLDSNKESTNEFETELGLEEKECDS